MRELITVLDTVNNGNRRRFVLLAVLTAIASIVEMAGIGLCIPFIATASGNLPFGTSRTITSLTHTWLSSAGIAPDHYTLALGSLFVGGLVLANLFLCIYQWFVLRVCSQQRRDIMQALLAKFTAKPIEWCDRHHTAELNTIMINEVDKVVASLNCVIQTISVAVRCLLIYSFFLIAQTRLALVMATSFVVCYFLVLQFVHRPLVHAGKQLVAAWEKMSRAMSEALAGAREIRVTGTRNHFLSRFRSAAALTVGPDVIRGMPPHVTRACLEIAAASIAVGVLVYFRYKDGGLANGLPLLSAFGIAAVRLLPNLQQGVQNWIMLRFYSSSVSRICELLSEKDAPQSSDQGPPMPFSDRLEFRQVSFGYEPGEPILDELSLTIRKNQRVAFVGATGAGKSTAADLLMGLRFPGSGSVNVDAMPLTPETFPSWRAKIGYVPQSIYLIDASVSENVAFGISPHLVEPARVEYACRLANLHEFIVQELPEGYATLVGERGARLSGGQAQRLGIARALYHDPEVLVLDEATSSLDASTELAVLEAMRAVEGVKTLIVIAHRLNTVWEFDQLFVLSKGKLVGHGTSKQLLAGCPEFQELCRDAGLEKNGRSLDQIRAEPALSHHTSSD